MEDIKQLSTLGRPLDTGYPSNAFILIFSGATFLGFGIAEFLSGAGILGGLAFGFRSLLSVFLAWAIGREVDPDRPATAALAAIGQVIVIQFIDVPSLMLGFWALFSFRILNRTTGLKAGIFDTVLAAAISGWLGYQLSWVIAAAGGTIFLADAFMKDPNRRHIVPGALLAGEAIYFLTLDPTVWTGFLNYPAKLGLILGISGTFLFVIYGTKEVTSQDDETSETLAPGRVQLTQFIALLIAILFPLWAGVQSFHQSATFWSVLGGSSLVHIVSAITVAIG